MAAVGTISSDSNLSSLSRTKQPGAVSNNSQERTQTVAEFSANSDAVVLDASFGTTVSSGAEQTESGNFSELYKSLSITSKEIVDKINERLKGTLPDGVQSLKPEQVTPEATAERIVSGVTAFFDIYAKQNKSLSGDKLVDSFISEVTRGVDEGYGDAIKILEGLGAFNVDGVRSGVEETRSLIDKKLAAFSVQKKNDLNPPPVANLTKTEVLTQAGGLISEVA